MDTDKELYIIQKEFPDSFVKLANRELKGEYEMHSIDLKKSSGRLDGYYLSKDDRDPLIVIENHGYDLKNFYLRFNHNVYTYCYQNEYYGDVVKVCIFLDEASYNSAKKPAHADDFIVYVLSEMSKDDLMSFNDDALMCLLPFCKITEEQLNSFYREWKDGIVNNKSYQLDKKSSLINIFAYFYAEVLSKSLSEAKKFLGVDIMESKLAKEIKQKGELEGIKKGKLETARNLKQLGIDIDKIARATGLSIKEIKALK